MYNKTQLKLLPMWNTIFFIASMRKNIKKYRKSYVVMS